jgi:lipopolysaccharide transport system ATP-binding protein
VYVNLAILGLSNDKIDAVFDDVARFAEIDDALDAPVQSYSSGMAARLGFACAVHANAEVLLIDEVLSVGDMRFRSKCYRKLAELRANGTSFILVSHNTNAILSMCNRAIYLSRGKQVMTGPPPEVMAKFEEDLSITPAMSENGAMVFADKPASDSSGLDFTALQLKNAQAIHIDHASTSETVTMELSLKCTTTHRNVIAAALIKELSGESETVLHLSSDKQGITLDFEPGNSKLNIVFPAFGLRPGIYTAKIYLYENSFYMLDVIESFVFRVRSEQDMNQCLFYQEVDWVLSA